jgi:hypothetical protein
LLRQEPLRHLWQGEHAKLQIRQGMLLQQKGLGKT